MSARSFSKFVRSCAALSLAVACEGPAPESHLDEPAEIRDRPVEPVPGPALGVPALWFEPTDLTTDSRGPYRIAIEGEGVSAATLEGLVSRVQLQRADGVSIAFDTSTEVVVAGVGYPRAYLNVRPGVALRPGWHTLTLSSPPAGVASAFRSASEFADGSIGTRFHVGSRPLVYAVRVCDRATEADTVVVDFSERVRSENSIATSVEVRGGTGACDFSAADVSNFDSLTGRCGGLAGIDSWEVRFAGLVGLSGVTVTAVAPDLTPRALPLAVTVSPATLEDWGGGCRGLRP